MLKIRYIIHKILTFPKGAAVFLVQKIIRSAKLSGKLPESFSGQDVESKLNNQLMSIQNSTRTSFRFFIPVHNNLRMKWRWYYLWHLNPNASKINISALALVCLSFVFGLSLYASSFSETKANQPFSGLKSVSVAVVGSRADIPNVQEKAKGKVDDSAAITGSSDQLTVNLSDRTTRNASVSVATQNKDGEVRKVGFDLLVPKDQVALNRQRLSSSGSDNSLSGSNKTVFAEAKKTVLAEAVFAETAQAADVPSDSSNPTNGTNLTNETNTPNVPKAVTSDDVKTKKEVASGVKIRENDGAKQKYSLEINPEITANYQVSPGKLKEDLVLNSPKALGSISSIDFNLSNLSNLSIISNPDSSYVLKDQQTQEGLFTLLKATLTDKTGNHFDDKIKLTLDQSANLARYEIDPNWLAQTNACYRQRLSSPGSDNSLSGSGNQTVFANAPKDCLGSPEYPLTIDPTVTVATSTTTNPNSFSKDRTLLEATNGDMVNIYSDGNGLSYKISSDHGNTWSATGTQIFASTLTDDYGFSSWITADNKIHLAYSNNGTNSYIFYRQMTYDTATHAITSTGTERTVESAGTSQAFPAVAVTSSGTIFVAYRYYDATNYTIKAKASTAADGSTWGAASTLSAAVNTNAATYPALTLWNDNPAVIYNFANASLRWNYATAGTFQTAGWANETIASDVGTALNQEFSIGQETSDHYLHLAWKDNSVGIKYRKCANAAASWDAASTAVTTGASHANDKNPSLGLGLNDAIYLYYSEYVGVNSYNIKYAEKIGSAGTFGVAVAVTTDNGNNLIAQAALKPTPVTQTGSSNAAINFNSPSSGSGTVSNVVIGSTWTVEAWVQFPLPTTGDGRRTLVKGTISNQHIVVERDGQLGVYNGNFYTSNYNVTSLTSGWHYLTGVGSSGTTKMYIDGLLVGTANMQLTDDITVLGNSMAYGGQNFGTIDELRISNIARYTSSFPPPINQFTTDGNTVGLWHFDEGSGTLAADSSSGGHNATLSGSFAWVAASAKIFTNRNSGINSYSPVVFVSGTASPYNLNYAPSVKRWTAAAAGNWETAANWTPSGAPAAGDIVVFDPSSVQNCTVTTFTSGNGIVDGLGGLYVETGYSGTINFQNKPSQNVDPYKINITGEFIINSGIVTSDGDTTVLHGSLADGRGNEYAVGSLVIGTNGNMNADAKGKSNGPGLKTTSEYGGRSANNSTHATYGSYSQPVSLGSGGNSGGAIKITSTGSVAVNGTMSASGTGSGGGSGGSIWITSASFSGNGSVVTRSGSNGCCAPSSGGGGRLAIYATGVWSFSGTESASKVVDGWNDAGGNGTVYEKRPGDTNGRLVLDNAGLDNGSDLGATLMGETDTGVYTFDAITVNKGSRLEIVSGQTVNASAFDITGGGACNTYGGGADAIGYYCTGLIKATGVIKLKDSPTISGFRLVDNGASSNSVQNSTGGSTFTAITLNSGGKLDINGTSKVFDITSGTTIGGDGTGSLTTFGTIKVPTSYTVSNYTLGVGTSCVKNAGGGCDPGWDDTTANTTLYGKITDPTGGNVVDLTIASGGALSQAYNLVQNTSTEQYKLIVNLRSLTIQTGGKVDVSGMGYIQGPAGGALNSRGGSYGGDGYGYTNSQYGSYDSPNRLGSGGTQYYGGQAGGGVAKIIATSVTNSGSILSNAPSNGAGGSIWLKTTNLTSTGTVSASDGSAYPGGSGGRIALEATGTYSVSSAVAYGGNWGGGNVGAAGTVFVRKPGEANGEIIIDNSNQATSQNTALKTSSDSGSYVFDVITVKNQGRLAIFTGQTLDISANTPFTGSATSGVLDVYGTLKVPATGWTVSNYTLEMGTTCKKADGTTLCDTGWYQAPSGGSITGKITDSSGGALFNMTVDTGGVVSHVANTTSESYKLILNLVNLTLQNGGKIDVSTQGLLGTGNYSYGGQGYPQGDAFGDYSNPSLLGGTAVCGYSTGGGGVAAINATGTVSANSTNSILANGGNNQSAAGGSINITTVNFAGNGAISANGYSTGCGAGSGGRVKISANSSWTYNGVDSAYSLGSYNGFYASAGTVFEIHPGEANGRLIVNNNGNTGPGYTFLKTSTDTATYAFDSISILNKGNFALSKNQIVTTTGAVTIASNSSLTMLSDNSGTPTQGAWPTLNVGGNLTLSGTVSADGNGFAQDAGPGHGSVVANWAYGSGGGYGGAGGNSSGGSVGGAAYGSQTNNNYLGSGGGHAGQSGAGNAGSGGGMVKMNVTGNLAMGATGKITANGTDGGAGFGGGSGGSVQVVVSGTLSGTTGATITANGGNSASFGGGGGGGRIAIYPATDTYTGAKTATGGTCGVGGGAAGGNGTIQVQHSPSAPTITAPSTDGAINQSQLIAFHFNSTDPDGDWIQYKLQLATDASFSQNVSTFDETVSQTPNDGNRTANFSNQDMATGKVAGTSGYSSGRDAVLTLATALHQGDTFYYRAYAYDPEGVDSFDGSKHWSAASAARSFTVAPIDHTAFTTAAQNITVTFCSAIMEYRIRNVINEDVALTATEGAKNFVLQTNSATGHFYSDGGCLTTVPSNTLTIGVGSNSANFFYKDTSPNPVGVPYTITVSETPSLGWTDATQGITVKPAGFGSFQLSGYPTNIVAGTPFTSPANDIVVTVKDVYGNTKNDWTGQIWFYSSDSQATFPYTDVVKYTFTTGAGGDNGAHTFPGTGFVLKTKDNQSIVVHNSEGSRYDAIGNIFVTAASTDHFGLASYPQTASQRFAMSNFTWDTPGFSAAPYNPNVTAYDAYNNVKDNFTGQVWFELYRGSDTPGNPASSTANFTFANDYLTHYTFTSGTGADNGVHQFAGSGFNVVTSGTDLRFRVKTSDNGNKFSDFTITVKPQSIDHFGITTTPIISRNSVNYEKQVDTTFSENVTLTAFDAFGNVKTDYGYDPTSKAGMVYFYSSDAQAVLPYTKTVSTDSSGCFQFPAGDLGAHTFTPQNTPTNYFKFQTGGYQSLSASECVDPTSTYATDPSTKKTDPRLEPADPSKNPASTGIFPASTNNPSKVYVTTHIPGSRHTATDHTGLVNDLIEAAPGYQQVTLTWTNPFDIPADTGLTPQAYIYRCAAGPVLSPTTDCSAFPTNYSKIVTTPNPLAVTAGTRTDYTDTGLTNGNHYYYKVSYAYKKQDNSYLETDKSITLDAVPADIAPREVTAVQLDRTDPANPGKVKVMYKLRWPSQVSLAYFNSGGNSWANASAPAQSGQTNGSFNGDASLPQYTAYFDPKVDFDGQFLNNTFKMRVKVTAQGSNAYADSSLLTLDSKNPLVNSIVSDASAGGSVNLVLNVTDDSNPIQMMISMDSGFAGGSWESYATSKNNFDLQNKNIIYFKFRDLENNLTQTSKTLYGTPANFAIKDGSTIATNKYRLTLVWDDVVPVPKTYHVFRSTDGATYSQVDTTTKNGFLDINLSSSITYAYKVQAEDTAGNLSIPAGPLSSQPGSAPDVTAKPKVELFGWKQDQGVRAKISWDTDQNADSSVAYSTSSIHAKDDMTADNGGVVKIAGDPKMTLNHEIWLYNLDPAAKYYFKVISKNEIQIAGYSDVLDFTTPERILLLISGTTISDITQTGALVSWSTSKLSITSLDYGDSTGYGATLIDTTLNTEHKFKLDKLKDGAIYHLRIKATDTDGNITTSDDYVFSTPAQPIISDFKATETSANSATLAWNTNVNTDSNVEFASTSPVAAIQVEGRAVDQNAPTAIQQGQQGKSDSTTIHSVTIIGLVAKQGYTATARGTDKFGNTAVSGQISFTTTADTTPPVISNLKSEITSSGSGNAIKYQAIISWETDESATSQVEYGQGVSGTYDSKTKEDLSLNQTHVIILNDLKANSAYHARVTSKDRSANQSFSDDFSLITPPKQKQLFQMIMDAITGSFSWVPRFLTKMRGQ